MSKLLSTLFFIVIGNILAAQAVVYSFSGQPGNQSSTPISSTLPGWSATSITRGSGIAGASAANSMSSNGFVVGATGIVADEFYEFTITTPATGGPHNIAGVSFDFRASGTGPQSYSIRTSVAGATETEVSTGSGVPNSTPGSVVVIPAETNIPNSTTYRVRVYPFGASAATGTFRLQSSISALPVTFSNLNVIHATTTTTQLTFTTASEQNNSHFEIERSADSRNFTKIGEVKGAGTSTQEQEYKFIDQQPLKGINYYRLKQVDFDGTSTYSKVVSVRFGNTRTLSVIPTMVYDQITVELDEMGEQEGQWQIFDLNGRQVLSGTLAGDQKSFQTDLTGLNEGTYLVRVQIGEEVLTEKVQKL